MKSLQPSKDNPARIRIYFNKYIHDNRPFLELVSNHNIFNFDYFKGVMVGRPMYKIDGVTLWTTHFLERPEKVNLSLLSGKEEPIIPPSVSIREFIKKEFAKLSKIF